MRDDMMDLRQSLSRTKASNSNGASVPICVTIAGSDSGGGAGIQADLKTFSALNVYGASVITAITAQNTLAVTAVHDIPAEIVAAQASVKIGMVSVPETIQAIAKGLRHFSGPVVLDPVMVAKSGDRLLSEAAISTLREKLIPLASVLTPNRPEAACLLDCAIARNNNEAEEQGRALLKLGAKAVLMKGGHAEGDICTDLLIRADLPTIQLEAPRIYTQNTHGTGCTLSSAIAAGLGKGLSLEKALREAHTYLQAAIRSANTLQVGSGHGPVHHFHALWEIA
jgi:hydroxymethylpyrimidine/phosphomethylpyrimidine kinase